MAELAWRRIHEVADAASALDAVDAGADWILFWCGGGSTRASGSPQAVNNALSHVRNEGVSVAEFQRQSDKAARKGRSKTIVFAEMWRRADGRQMVVFHEGGPYPLPDRAEPDRL